MHSCENLYKETLESIDDVTYHIIGPSSFIAQALILKLQARKKHTFSYSSKNRFRLRNFEADVNSKSIIIYFSIIKDDLRRSIEHLASIQNIANMKGGKFIYISTKNAESPDASYYSYLKYRCETYVIANGGVSIRLGLITSTPAKGPFRSLLVLGNLPVKLVFPNNTLITTTQIEDFLDYDFSNANERTISSVYSSNYSLNELLALHRKRRNIATFDLSPFIYMLKKLNKVYSFRGILGRILTLNGITR